MVKKLSIFVVLLLLASAVLTACKPAGPDCSKEEIFCIGLVTDVGEVDDKSFNQAAWEAVQQAEKELGATIKYVETKDAKDYMPNIELFAKQNYDVIVTNGFAITDTTREAAQKYPNIKFIALDQFQSAGTLPNVTGVVFKEDQSGYLAGVLAAKLSKSGVIAAVLGTDIIPAVVAFKEGYEAGAKATNPDIKVISTYHPGGLDVAFTDPEWGAATAKQAIEQGADVVFGAGGKTGNGALTETAANAGLFCIGVDLDQWITLPEAHPCLVSSAMKLITPAIFGLIKDAKAGTMTPGDFYGIVGLAPYHDFDSKIDQAIKDLIVLTEAGLIDGSIATGYVP
jgi:basic membrane protein A